MKKNTWLLLILLPLLVFVNPLFAVEDSIEFTPQNGFSGASRGQGTLKLFFGQPRPFTVKSFGITQSDGTFRLDQTITFQGEPPKHRFWILSPNNNNHYSAILSDAAGSVKGVTIGSNLSLHYRVKGLFYMHQQMQLSPDGKIIDNVGVVRLLGIPVGHLHEIIMRRP